MECKVKFLEDIYNILDKEHVKFEVPMKEYTTFKLGGNAEIFVTPETFEEIRDLLRLCVKYNVPYFVIGKGSNILVKDGGVKGVIVNLNKLKHIKIDKFMVTAGAGASLIEVALYSGKNGLSGLEFASGIPGSIGGAIAMNAGAYGGEICQVVKSVKVIDDELNIKDLSLEEMQFSYRNSIVLKKSYVVLEATFELKEGNKDEIKAIVQDLTRRRVEKQPLDKPSAGSTFKRPEGYYAGKLIQDSGLKGYKIGGAQVSDKHSNFVINNGDASAKEILQLIKHIQDTVFDKFKVNLETEVRIIGYDKED